MSSVISFSAVQIYDLSYIHLHSAPLHSGYGHITNSQGDQFPVGLIAQLVDRHGRALRRYRKGKGFESHLGLNFFSGFDFTTAKDVCITTMINHVFIASISVTGSIDTSQSRVSADQYHVIIWRAEV